MASDVLDFEYFDDKKAGILDFDELEQVECQRAAETAIPEKQDVSPTRDANAAVDYFDDKKAGILDLNELEYVEGQRDIETAILDRPDISTTEEAHEAAVIEFASHCNEQAFVNTGTSGTVAAPAPDIWALQPAGNELASKEQADKAIMLLAAEEPQLEAEAEQRRRFDTNKQKGIAIAKIKILIPSTFKHMGKQREEFFVELLVLGIARINKFMRAAPKQSFARVDGAWKMAPTLFALELFISDFAAECVDMTAMAHSQRIITYLFGPVRSLHTLLLEMSSGRLSQSSAQLKLSLIENVFRDLAHEAIELARCLVAPSEALKQAMSLSKDVLAEALNNMTPQLAEDIYKARTLAQCHNFNENHSIIRRTNPVSCTCLLYDLRAGLRAADFQSLHGELRSNVRMGKIAEAEMLNSCFLYDVRDSMRDGKHVQDLHAQELQSRTKELLNKVQIGKSAAAEMVNLSFKVQKSVVPRYGFPGTADGVKNMLQETGSHADGCGPSLGCNGDKIVGKLRWDIHTCLELSHTSQSRAFFAFLKADMQLPPQIAQRLPILLYHCTHPHGFFSMFSLVLGHVLTCEARGTALCVDWSSSELLHCGPPGQPNLWEVFFKHPAEALMSTQVVSERLAKNEYILTTENNLVYGAFKGAQESYGGIPLECATHGRALCRRWIQLQPQFEIKLQELEDDLLGEKKRWLAVHIRRGDKAVEAASNLMLTTDAIVRRIAAQCVAWRMDGVFLCSDDAKLKSQLAEQLSCQEAPGGAALTVSTYAATLTVDAHNCTHMDTSLDGFRKAEDICTEAFLMARYCHGLLSTYSNVSASVVYLSAENYPYTTFFDPIDSV